MKLKWGIYGVEGITVHDFVLLLKNLPKNHQLQGVADEDNDAARKFATVHKLRCYIAFDTMCQDVNVQVVFVNCRLSERKKIVSSLLNKKKHVVCRMPLAINQKQTKELLQLAKKKKLLLMECIWPRAYPVYTRIRALLDTNQLGRIQFLSAIMGGKVNSTCMITTKDKGCGATMMLGGFVLQLLLFVFKGMEPLRVVAAGVNNDEGLDVATSVIVTYPYNAIAVLTYDATAYSSEALIMGTKGSIRIENFTAPASYMYKNMELKKPVDLPNAEGTFLCANSHGMSYLVEEMRTLIRTRKVESKTIPHDESVRLAALLDTVRLQLGVVFKEDLE